MLDIEWDGDGHCGRFCEFSEVMSSLKYEEEQDDSVEVDPRGVYGLTGNPGGVEVARCAVCTILVRKSFIFSVIPLTVNDRVTPTMCSTVNWVCLVFALYLISDKVKLTMMLSGWTRVIRTS